MLGQVGLFVAVLDEERRDIFGQNPPDLHAKHVSL